MNRVVTTTSTVTCHKEVSAKNIQSVCESLTKAYSEAAAVAAANMSPDDAILYTNAANSIVDQSSVLAADMESMPPLPLPWWFGPECENSFKDFAPNDPPPTSAMGAPVKEEAGTEMVSATNQQQTHHHRSVAADDNAGCVKKPPTSSYPYRHSSAAADNNITDCVDAAAILVTAAAPTVIVTDAGADSFYQVATTSLGGVIVATTNHQQGKAVAPLEDVPSPPHLTAAAPSSVCAASDSSTIVFNSVAAGVTDGDVTMTFVQPLSDADLRAKLKSQLEWYFSRENLAVDNYLRSQMDNDQFVPIKTVANFNMVKKMTHDIDLIVQLYRESPLVQVDEKGEKVRPVHKRCTLILREIPDNTSKQEVEQLFSSPKCPKIVSCEYAHNNSWYINFESDEHAQLAYVYLQKEVVIFKDKAIKARIKTAPIPRVQTQPAAGGGFIRPLPLLATQTYKGGILSSPGADSAAVSSGAASSPIFSAAAPSTFTAVDFVDGGAAALFAVAAPPGVDSASTSTVSLNPAVSGSMEAMSLVAASPVMTPPWPGAGPPQFFDIGHILALNGFQAQGTFRPSVQTVLVPASSLGPAPLNVAHHHPSHSQHHFMDRNLRSKRFSSGSGMGTSGAPRPGAYFYNASGVERDFEPGGRQRLSAGGRGGGWGSPGVAESRGGGQRGGDYGQHFNSFRTRQNAGGLNSHGETVAMGSGGHHGGVGFNLRVPDGSHYRSLAGGGGRGRGGAGGGGYYGNGGSSPNRANNHGGQPSSSDYHANADYWSVKTAISQNSKDKPQQRQNHQNSNSSSNAVGSTSNNDNANSLTQQPSTANSLGGGAGRKNGGQHSAGGAGPGSLSAPSTARRKNSSSTSATAAGGSQASAAGVGGPTSPPVSHEFDFQPSSFPPLPTPKTTSESTANVKSHASSTESASGPTTDATRDLLSTSNSASAMVTNFTADASNTDSTTSSAPMTSAAAVVAGGASVANHPRAETFSHVLTRGEPALADAVKWPKAGAASVFLAATEDAGAINSSDAVQQLQTTVVRAQRVVIMADKATATDSPVQVPTIDSSCRNEMRDTESANDLDSLAPSHTQQRIANGPLCGGAKKPASISAQDGKNCAPNQTSTLSSTCQSKLSYAAMAKQAVDKSTSANTIVAPKESGAKSTSLNHIDGHEPPMAMLNGDTSADSRHFIASSKPAVVSIRRQGRSDSSESPSAPFSSLRKYQNKKAFARNVVDFTNNSNTNSTTRTASSDEN